MLHKKPRGHSNVYADETTKYLETDKACIPMIGGSRVDTCKALPPLALGKDEWEEIGRRMKWQQSDLLAALKMVELACENAGIDLTDAFVWSKGDGSQSGGYGERIHLLETIRDAIALPVEASAE